MNYQALRQTVYRVIADRAGMNPQVFVDMPISGQRRYMERRTGKPMNFTGASSGVRVLSHAEIETMLDGALS